MKKHLIGIGFLAALVLVVGPVLARAEAAPQKQTFIGYAINTGLGPRATGSTLVQISVERWSTDAEQQELLSALKTKGEMAMYDVLQKLPRVGIISLPNTIGYDLHYAYQVLDDQGGRRIVLATDRYLSFFEVTTGTRSLQYPFTLIELHLNKENKGEGKMSIATKVALSPEGKMIELENYGALPVLIERVKEIK